MQQELIQTSLLPCSRTKMDAKPELLIEGLVVIPDFISTELELKLVEMLDSNVWEDDLKRRVQHFGHRYDYYNKSRRGKVESIPYELECLKYMILKTGKYSEEPNQVIVNEYVSGQGIASHIDCTRNFHGPICTLSLLDTWNMKFVRDDEKLEIPLFRRSLVIMDGPARTEWTHGIPTRKNDIIDGAKKARSRRISITFRQKKISGLKTETFS